MEEDIRWEQRLQNFSRSVKLMQELKELDINNMPFLLKEGMVQRFEFSLELAWKTLKDKMEFDGIILDKISPKVVIKEAFKSKYINDVDVWLQMINDRNLLSHTYDLDMFEKILPDIQSKYVDAITDLFINLNDKT